MLKTYNVKSFIQRHHFSQSANKANTLQSRAVVKTIRPKKEPKRLKDQKTKRLKD